MAPRYPNLFSPFETRRFSLKNRIVVLPYGTSMVHDGAITDEDIAHFETIAKTGPGLIINGSHVVHPSSAMRVRKLVEAYNETALESLQRRTERIKSYGVVVFGQILHLGREWIGMDSDYAPSAPSPIRSPRDPYPPHELDLSEIAELIEAFGASALNLKRAGYDGVELHAAHGYLFAQFLSAATNQRSDQYGGSPERRFRFLEEVIAAIRTRCGDDFGLSVRLSAEEETVDGMELGDTRRIAEALAKLESVDVLNITLGMRGGYVKDMTGPEAPAANAAREIRRACGLPVIVGQRISAPETAERVLAEGAGDLVGMARAFFADPEWIKKAKAGEADRIRPCLHLNQDCRAFSPHLHCAVNPTTGRETWPEFAALRSAAKRKRIAVIGGGPAGLECALTAARRGHEVSLFEASGGFGGQFLLAAAIPRRSGLTRLIDYQVRELRGLGIEMRLGTPIVAPKDIAGEFDTAVLATGAEARPLAPELAGAGAVSWMDVLTEGAPAPFGEGRAVFVDDGTGFWWNYGVAEALVEAGWRLTIVTGSAAVGHMMPAESIGPLLARLARGETRFRVLASLADVLPGEARLMHIVSGEEEALACDLVVVQSGRQPVAGPAAALRESGVADVRAIGDCVTPRRVSFALFEAQRLARAI